MQRCSRRPRHGQHSILPLRERKRRSSTLAFPIRLEPSLLDKRAMAHPLRAGRKPSRNRFTGRADHCHPGAFATHLNKLPPPSSLSSSPQKSEWNGVSLLGWCETGQKRSSFFSTITSHMNLAVGTSKNPFFLFLFLSIYLSTIALEIAGFDFFFSIFFFYFFQRRILLNRCQDFLLCIDFVQYYCIQFAKIAYHSIRLFDTLST